MIASSLLAVGRNEAARQILATGLQTATLPAIERANLTRLYALIHLGLTQLP
jgi:hypothetical protein